MYVSINLSPFLTLSIEKRIHLFPGNVTFTSFILKERENICPTEKSLISLFETYVSIFESVYGTFRNLRQDMSALLTPVSNNCIQIRTTVVVNAPDFEYTPLRCCSLWM